MPSSRDSPPSGAARHRFTRAWRIVAAYGVFATLWIIFSDRALAAVTGAPAAVLTWNLLKGLAFVLVTTFLLWFVVRKAYGTIEAGYHSLSESERAQRELARQLSLERSRLLEVQRIAKVGSWVADSENLAVAWSEETHRIFETDPATFTPSHQAFLERIHPDDREAVDVAFRGSFASDEPREIEHRVLLPDGRVKRVVERWQIFRDAPGQPPRAVGSCRDVTAQREAEADSRRTAILLQAVLDSTPDMIFVKDLDGRYLLCNEAAARFAGMTAEEMIGCIDDDFFPPEEARAIAARDRQIVLDGAPGTAEEALTTDGATRTYLTTKSPYRDARGGIIGIVGISRDISQRKEAEQALRESETRFREMAENIGEIFYNYDPVHNRLLYASPSYERIWGRPRERLGANPTSYLDDIHPDDRDIARGAFQRQLAGESTQASFRIVRPDGELRWLTENAVPVADASGRIERIVGTIRDVTEAKLAETKLTEQAALLEKSRDAIIVRHLSHEIAYWNHGAELLYGWSAAEVRGRSIRELLYQDDRDFLAATAEVLENGEWNGEISQFTREGRKLVVEGRWTLLRDDAGQPLSVLAINTDITGRKQLEQQFLRSQRMESIGTLAGGIAHDLNNVLAPVIMSVDLLKHRLADPADLEILGLVGDSARRGADMVQQILTFARGMEGNRVEVNVGRVLQEVARIARDTFPKNIDIELQSPAEPWTIIADPTQLHQILLNLSLNARDAMPDGGNMVIRAINVPPGNGSPDPHLRIEVADNGSGIPADRIQRIFDPFFTTKETGKGTGLGLSTALAIVRSHGGTIGVESQPGTGTTFTVNLPALVSPGPGAARTGSLPHPRGRGETVLVVDDEASIRHITRQTLEAYGYDVIVAPDGAEAINLFTARRLEIDAVITDMMMPRLDGQSLIAALRRLDRAIPIIGVSGISTQNPVGELPGVRFLAKPFTTPSLLTILREALDSTGR